MVGYITVNRQELKLREFEEYRTWYCGLCRSLKHRYGVSGQLTISYDMTFLVLLLSDLYDRTPKVSSTHCVSHPVGKKQEIRYTDVTDYAADMNVILAYYKCLDDWDDERRVDRRLFAAVLSKGKKKAGIDYGRKVALIKDRLDRLHEAEQRGETDVDTVSGYFGDILAEVFAMEDDEWESTLRRFGYFLGKFIYLMDAYDDLEKDEKHHRYNVFSCYKDREDFESFAKQVLTMMISKACEAFEVLPLVENAALLRNILYSGVWSRYNAIQEKRAKEKENTAPVAGDTAGEQEMIRSRQQANR